MTDSMTDGCILETLVRPSMVGDLHVNRCSYALGTSMRSLLCLKVFVTCQERVHSSDDLFDLFLGPKPGYLDQRHAPFNG